MDNFKSIALILLLAVVGVGCGTDGLQVKQESLSFTNSGDIPDYIPAGQQYSFTINIENGTASNAALTAFTDNGNWLNAQVVNDGTAIELSGIPSSSQAGSYYNFYLSGADANGLTAVAYFGVYVGN